MKNIIVTIYLVLNMGAVFAYSLQEKSNSVKETTFNNTEKMSQLESSAFEENKGQVTGAEANQVLPLLQ